MSPLEREDRIQVLARQLLVERSHGGQTLETSGQEVTACFELAEFFVDTAAERKAELALPLPPVDLSEPESP